MIVTFKNKALRKFFEEGDESRLHQRNLKRLRFILIKLDTAKEIRDLDFSGSGLHQLSGDLRGFWSVKITTIWRLIFQFRNENAYNVDFIDYH